LEGLLYTELQTLGAEDLRETVAGIYFSGDIGMAYRACLWSRLANKILLPLASFEADSQEELYDGVRELRWEEHLSPNGTLLVDFIGTNDTIRRKSQRCDCGLPARFQRRTPLGRQARPGFAGECALIQKQSDCQYRSLG
jgi:23S rRNA G2445 N2-methylase RlmL